MSYRFADLKDRHSENWRAYVQHDFVRQLGAGTLPADSFRHYLKQDYLFLIHFGRAYALAVYKSRNINELRHAMDGLKTIIDVELGLHVDYCKQWGISEDDLARLPEARATMAYTRYVLDTGNRGDLLDLHVALAPCLIGYAEVSRFLAQYPDTKRGDANPYEAWLKMYESEAFQGAAEAEERWLNARLANVAPGRFDELATIFDDATRLEIDFWQMGLDRLT